LHYCVDHLAFADNYIRSEKERKGLISPLEVTWEASIQY